MATFRLISFGCRASQADGAALKRELLEAGLEEAGDIQESQVAVLNTCTVTATADAEARQMIRRIHRQNPDCRILVTGCYAQRAAEEIARLPGVAWVVGNSHKHKVAELLRWRGQRHPLPGAGTAGLVEIQACAPPEASSQGSPPFVLVGEIRDAFHFAPVFPDDRTRPTLKIQDGCNARCSFCIIPAVRGRSRSLPPGKIIEQVRELVETGFQEIVLSGINLGGYGKDLDPRINFLGLVELVLSRTAIPRVRISSIEPMDVSPEVIRLVANEPRLAQHLHVPLQSGCDRILRLMNRRYWTTQYAERVLSIREQIPRCGIGADVMVGFPGETDRDHAASARFIESLPLTYLHVFPFSPRPGTAASGMGGQVNGRVAWERSREIRGLSARKHRQFLEAQLGQTLSVLTLDDDREGARIALSSNYLKVLLPHVELAANRIVDAHIVSVRGDYLCAGVATPAGTALAQAATSWTPGRISSTIGGLREPNSVG